MSQALPRFIELVLTPRERDQTDSFEVQRMALESLREVRPGMLIDHIEEPAGSGSGPIKGQPLFMRLRSHAEARTFDELRVFELGRLVRVNDPEWHQAVIELAYQGKAILVDTAGLVSDPASENQGRTPRRPGAKPQPRGSGEPSHQSPARTPSVPPSNPGRGAPARSEASESPPAIAFPTEHRPPPGGRPAERPSIPLQAARPRTTPPVPAPLRVQPGGHHCALCDGRLFCPTCAQPLTIQSMGHERRLYYTCASKHLHPPTDCLPELFFPVEVVDSVVWSRIAATLADPRLALDLVRSAAAKGAKGTQDRSAQHQARLERLERDELQVLGLRSEDLISEGAARHRLDEIRTERRRLEDERTNESRIDGKLAPLSKVLEELIAFQQRSGQGVDQADHGLRRRVVEACLPLSAEYGILPHADGSLELRDVLESFTFAPTLEHRVRSLGRRVGSLKDYVATAFHDREDAAPGPIAGLLTKFRRDTPTPASSSQDLGEALRANVSEHGTLAPSSGPPRQHTWIFYAFLLTGAILIAILFQPPKVDSSPYTNQATDLGLGDQLSELNQVPGGWIGLARTDWIGATDRAVASQLCASMAGRLTLGPNETITLMVPGGLPIAECRAPRPAAGSR